MKKKRPRKTAAVKKSDAKVSVKSRPKTRSKIKSAVKKTSSRKVSAKKTEKVFSPKVKGILTRRRATLTSKEKVEVEPLSAAVPMPAPPKFQDLPFSYNQTKLVLMIRDPEWAFIYWDFSGETWNWIVSLRERDSSLRPKLRVHNLDQGLSYDVDVNLEAKNWYLALGSPETSFELELGLLDSHGKFHRIALSNRLRTPRSGPSQKIDPQWELTEFEMSELYGQAAKGKKGDGSSLASSFKRRSS